MKYNYNTTGCCARSISFEINDGRISDICFVGGCDGNHKGIASLCEGMEIAEVIKRCEGIRCGFKSTSCPDQLAQALKKLPEKNDRRKKYLLLIADIDEFAPFTDSLKANGVKIKEYIFKGMKALDFSHGALDITAVCFGIGKVNAATGASLALADGKYDGVINTGWSGAVSGVFKGDILVADSCVECDCDFTALGKKPGEKPCQDKYIYSCSCPLAEKIKTIDGFTHGPIGCGDLFLCDSEKSEEYKKNFGIKAFDMESGALASVCELLGVPFVSIRKISDNASDAALSEYRSNLSESFEAFYDIVIKVFDSLQN